MKTYDFIRANIGNKVYITGHGDLAMCREFRNFIFNKTEFTLIKLSKGGMAILSDDNGKEFSVPPSNVCQVDNGGDSPTNHQTTKK